MHMKRIYLPSAIWAEVDLSRYPCEQVGLSRGGHTVHAVMRDDICLKFLQEYGEHVRKLEFITSDPIERVFGMEIDSA